MMRYALLFLPLGIISLYSSCVTDPIPCIRVSSSEVTETRDLKGFGGIVMYEYADLVITQGPDYSVKLTGPENVVELTNTSLVDDYLTISSEDCFNGSYSLKIEVTAPEFELIYVSALSSVETANTINGKRLEIELVGDITGNFDLNVDSVYSSIHGIGITDYSGTAVYHKIESSGEYTLKGFPLITDHSDISLFGLGECEVTANDKLNVVIEGSGNIYYKGSPAITSDITGTGQIIDSN